jgi:hypothetical protein
MNKKDRRIQLRKETVALLSPRALEQVGGGATPSNQCSAMCSRVQGSCLTCGPTQCG